MKKHYFTMMMALLLSISSYSQAPLITSVVDACGTDGKFVELYASGTVDFADYKLVRRSNSGTWADNGVDVDISALGIRTDEFVYICRNITTLGTEFPGAGISAANAIEDSGISHNGNDSWRLVEIAGDVVIDQFGSDINGSGEPWEYEDSWATRNSGSVADGNFNIADWSFGAVNVLDGFGLCNDPLNQPLEVEAASVGNFIPPSPPVTGTTLAGPFSVVNPNTVTVNVNDASNSAGFSTLVYDSFEITVDWISTDNAYSSEADIDVITSGGTVSIDPPTSGAAPNGLATTLTFSGDFAGTYEPGVDGTLDLVLNQSWNESSADWSNIVITLFEVPSCPEPENLQIVSAQTDSADVSWDAVAEADGGYSWVVYAQGDDPDTATEVSQGNFAAGTTSGQITGLSPQTDYDFYLVSLCGAETSLTAGPVSFTTACAPIAAPYLEDFEAFTVTTNFTGENCWNEVSPTAYDWEVDSNGTDSSNTGPDGPFSGSRYLVVDASDGGDGDVATLESPVVDLSGLTTPSLSFYYHMYGAFVTQLDVEVSADGGAFTNVLNIVGQQQTSSDSPWIQAVVDLSAFAGQNVVVRFITSKSTDAGNTFEGDVSIDDVNFDEVPTCIAPINIVASNITSDSVDISWDEESGASNGYVWSVYTSPSDPDADDAVQTGTTPFGTTTVNVSALMSNTAYDFYINSDCGENGTSDLVGPISFTTECAAFIPDYTEDFETFLPGCWEEASNGDPATGPTDFGSGDWGADGFLNNGFSGSARVNLYNLDTSDWLISPEFDLSAGGYEVVFDIGLTAFSGSGDSEMGSDDEVQLLYTDDGGTTWNNLITWNASNKPANSGELSVTDLSAITGTNVQFAFWASEGEVDDTEDYNIYVDNFEVRTPPAPANVQVIHNSADPSAELVDVYINGVLELDDLAFRTATPFVSLPAGVPVSIDIAPSTSTDVSESIYNLTTTLASGESYIIVANGVLDPTQFDSSVNASIDFNLDVFAGAQQVATNGVGETSILVNHGSPDAPTVDVRETSVPAGIFVDDISYTDFQGYFDFVTQDYVIDVELADNSAVVASYEANLATLGTDNLALTVLASGFLDPSANQNGAAFGLWVALPTGGDLVELPLIVPPPANDNLCDAIPLTVGAPTTADAYSNVSATAEPNEPVPACFVDDINGSVWFSFVAPASGDVTITTDIAGSTSDDTEIAVYDAPTDCADLTTLGPDLGCDQDSGTIVNFNSILSIDSLTPGNTYFIQVDIWNSTFSPDLAFGEFGIRVLDNNPPCPEPTNLNITNITSDSATLNWDDITEATLGYEWSVYASPSNPESDSLVAGGTTDAGVTTADVSGLMSETTYDFYVSSDCDADGLSILAGPVSFTTNPAPVTVDCSTGTPESVTVCYGNDENLFYTFTSNDGTPLTVSFIEGYFEDCCDDIIIYDGLTTSDGILFQSDTNFNNDATGIEATSTGDSIAVQIVSDGSVSCAAGSGSGIPLNFEVSCVAADTLDFFNLQFPATGNITVGGSFSVFAQAYEMGLTDASDTPAAGIEAWIGYSTTDTSPDTTADWTWVAATPNVGFDFTQNNDEYTLDLGAVIPSPGTYYYASRWRLNGGAFTYGGILPDGSNGGEWGTGGFVSGVLTVDPIPNDDISGAIPITVDEGFCDGTNTNASNEFATGGPEAPGSCFNGVNADNDVWFTFVGPPNTTFVNVSTDFTGGTLVDTEMSVYSGTPGNLTELACSQDEGVTILSNGNSWNSLITDLPVTPGETYYIQVAGYGTTDIGTFCLDVSSACISEAGTLTADADTVSLSGGTATISATEDVAPTVPAGYQVLYVLTSGTGLVIEQTNATPSFDVTAAGDYTIHTLVYDPATLDLSIVVPGTTTGFDVNALLIQGGGDICASLDVAGAPITVLEECLADAGTLTADATPVELAGGTATISATEDVAPTVPAGYQTLYVLTSGAGLVIEQTSATPSFDVTAVGDYTIHTLVYDPATLDLSIVVPGTTTGFDVNALLIQGGGDICASLDVAGAPITVLEECLADAGTLIANGSPVELSDGTATISATEDVAPTVPAGYQVLYVLTSGTGLVIEQTSATPSFDVTVAGDYTIHTLVYDPATLDLSIVVPGTTTGFDVNALLIQGGGTICASLDVIGAPITVLDECLADAGTLTIDDNPVQLIGGIATVSATVDTPPTVPAGYTTLFVLTSGTDLVIVQTNTAPSFDVTDAGDYTIHTLVYDPATLDLSIVVPGTTTGFDVNALLIQGGGTICASLDVAGAPVTVQTMGIEDAEFIGFSFYPNPVSNTLNLETSNQVEEIKIFNILGQGVMKETPNTVSPSINVEALQSGTYLMNVTINGVTKNFKFIKE